MSESSEEGKSDSSSVFYQSTEESSQPADAYLYSYSGESSEDAADVPPRRWGQQRPWGQLVRADGAIIRLDRLRPAEVRPIQPGVAALVPPVRQVPDAGIQADNAIRPGLQAPRMEPQPGPLLDLMEGSEDTSSSSIDEEGDTSSPSIDEEGGRGDLPYNLAPPPQAPEIEPGPGPMDDLEDTLSVNIDEDNIWGDLSSDDAGLIGSMITTCKHCRSPAAFACSSCSRAYCQRCTVNH